MTFTSFSLAEGRDWPSGAAATLPATKPRRSSELSTLLYRVVVRNTGTVDSDVVVTAMWSPDGPLAVRTPVRRQLFDYTRVRVAKGVSLEVSFTISTLSLVFAAPNGDLVSSPGAFKLVFDDGSGEASGTVGAVVNITGQEAVVMEAFPRGIGAGSSI